MTWRKSIVAPIVASLAALTTQAHAGYPTKVIDGTCTLLALPTPTAILTPRAASITPAPVVETSVYASLESSSSELFGLLGSWSQDWTTLSIVTLLMPQLTADLSMSQEVVYTEIVDLYMTHTIFEFDSCAQTLSSSELGLTSLTTYSVFPAEKTYLPASATGPDSVPCTGDEREFEPDEECKALGMDTACIGQCEAIADGSFRCRQEAQNEEYPRNYGRLGRGCWLVNDTFHQLVKPCLNGDHWVGCMPGGGGWNGSYRPLLWL